MNTLLEGPSEMTYYTDLALVFRALGGRQKEFNWLVTDFEGHVLGNSLQDVPAGFGFGSEPKWLSGEALTPFVERNPIQFVWAVLSCFPLGVVLDPGRLDVEPYADGNPMFWGEHVAVQHPEAVAEIVCWDSTRTFLLSKDEDLSRRFRGFFTGAVDLGPYNRHRGAF